MLDLFDGGSDQKGAQESLAEGAVILRGFALEYSDVLLAAVQEITGQAPFRHMIVPGGRRMSVAITNCGDAGWVSDRSGYRYDARDPNTGKPWPPLPECFTALASRAAAQAGFDLYVPDACLMNCYVPGAGVSLHQDKNERDFTAPIVSVSLGLPAIFLFGGLQRTDRARRVRLEHGDAAVWGGAARLAYHGIAPIKDAEHGVLGRQRINLTFRKAR